MLGPILGEVTHSEIIVALIGGFSLVTASYIANARRWLRSERSRSAIQERQNQLQAEHHQIFQELEEERRVSAERWAHVTHALGLLKIQIEGTASQLDDVASTVLEQNGAAKVETEPKKPRQPRQPT